MDTKNFDFTNWVKPQDVINMAETYANMGMTFVPYPLKNTVEKINAAGFEFARTATDTAMDYAGSVRDAVFSASKTVK
jgi:hypothetical protein